MSSNIEISEVEAPEETLESTDVNWSCDGFVLDYNDSQTEKAPSFLFEKTPENGHKFTFVRKNNPKLSDILFEITDNEKFINEDVIMFESDLFPIYEEMKIKVESGMFELLELVLFLSECFALKNEQYDKMSEMGKITFEHLSKIFHVGQKFVSKEEGELVGSIVSDARVVQTPMTKLFKITGTFTFSNGKTFYQENRDFYIPFFSGTKYIESLNVKPMNKDDELLLTNRGKTFLKYALGPNYVSYKGTMFINTMYGPMHFNSNGRIMIDHIGSRKNKPDAYYGNKTTFDTIPEELLYLTWPFFDAFSFKEKRWGKAYVRSVAEIKYNDNAFESLVLDENKKKLIKSLVLHSNKGFSDIIQDKNGGCIFLLHGGPGIGKTLTAESIAELLHRPLYSITVGELGTTVDTLEKKLANILEMTENWNAVLLVDECDIFLESRADGNIERNAMVGIFLRLLERHKGVMFLTTNRINSLDDAFESRISVIVKYNNLNQESRLKVWKNLLKDANIKSLSDEEIESLSQTVINGRQIKNCIKMSQALAFDDEIEVNINHVKQSLSNIFFKNEIST